MIVADDTVMVGQKSGGFLKGVILTIVSDNSIAALNVDLLCAALAKHLQERQLRFADVVGELKKRRGKDS